MRVDAIRDQLAALLGLEMADAVLAECLKSSGVAETAPPATVGGDDLERIGACLIEQGGLIQLVGRTLKARVLAGKVKSRRAGSLADDAG